MRERENEALQEEESEKCLLLKSTLSLFNPSSHALQLHHSTLGMTGQPLRE